MSDDLKEIAKHDKENTSKTKVFSLLSYLCLAACIFCSIIGKWVFAGLAGVGIILFSYLESVYEKKSMSNVLEDALDIKEKNL